MYAPPGVDSDSSNEESPWPKPPKSPPRRPSFSFKALFSSPDPAENISDPERHTVNSSASTTPIQTQPDSAKKFVRWVEGDLHGTDGPDASYQAVQIPDSPNEAPTPLEQPHESQTVSSEVTSSPLVNEMTRPATATAADDVASKEVVALLKQLIEQSAEPAALPPEPPARPQPKKIKWGKLARLALGRPQLASDAVSLTSASIPTSPAQPFQPAPPNWSLPPHAPAPSAMLSDSTQSPASQSSPTPSCNAIHGSAPPTNSYSGFAPTGAAQAYYQSFDWPSSPTTPVSQQPWPPPPDPNRPWIWHHPGNRQPVSAPPHTTSFPVNAQQSRPTPSPPQATAGPPNPHPPPSAPVQYPPAWQLPHQPSPYPGPLQNSINIGPLGHGGIPYYAPPSYPHPSQLQPWNPYYPAQGYPSAVQFAFIPVPISSQPGSPFSAMSNPWSPHFTRQTGVESRDSESDHGNALQLDRGPGHREGMGLDQGNRNFGREGKANVANDANGAAPRKARDISRDRGEDKESRHGKESDEDREDMDLKDIQKDGKGGEFSQGGMGGQGKTGRDATEMKEGREPKEATKVKESKENRIRRDRQLEKMDESGEAIIDAGRGGKRIEAYPRQEETTTTRGNEAASMRSEVGGREDRKKEGLVSEDMVRQYEGKLGRSLTEDELRGLQKQAQKQTKKQAEMKNKDVASEKRMAATTEKPPENPKLRGDPEQVGQTAAEQLKFVYKQMVDREKQKLGRPLERDEMSKLKVKAREAIMDMQKGSKGSPLTTLRGPKHMEEAEDAAPAAPASKDDSGERVYRELLKRHEDKLGRALTDAERIKLKTKAFEASYAATPTKTPTTAVATPPIKRVVAPQSASPAINGELTPSSKPIMAGGPDVPKSWGTFFASLTAALNTLFDLQRHLVSQQPADMPGAHVSPLLTDVLPRIVTCLFTGGDMAVALAPLFDAQHQYLLHNLLAHFQTIKAFAAAHSIDSSKLGTADHKAGGELQPWLSMASMTPLGPYLTPTILEICSDLVRRCFSGDLDLKGLISMMMIVKHEVKTVQQEEEKAKKEKLAKEHPSHGVMGMIDQLLGFLRLTQDGTTAKKSAKPARIASPAKSPRPNELSPSPSIGQSTTPKTAPPRRIFTPPLSMTASSVSVYSQSSLSSDGTIESDEEAAELLAHADSGPASSRPPSIQSTPTNDSSPDECQVLEARALLKEKQGNELLRRKAEEEGEDDEVTFGSASPRPWGYI